MSCTGCNGQSRGTFFALRFNRAPPSHLRVYSVGNATGQTASMQSIKDAETGVAQ